MAQSGIAPSAVSWVKARSQCSVGNAFKQLEQGARCDVEEMNVLLGERTRMSYAVSSGSGRHFSVVRIEDPMLSNISSSVDFELGNDHIAVVYNMPNNEKKLLFNVGVTLDNEGLCKLTATGKDGEFEPWHIRRMALEKLFFS
jgi:hypothetical protein